MQPDPSALERTIIRLPLPRYAKWAVRVWVVLFLLSPLLVFFSLSILQILILAAILGGFVLESAGLIALWVWCKKEGWL